MPVKDTCVSRLKTSKAMRENALDVAVAYQGVFKRLIVCRWSSVSASVAPRPEDFAPAKSVNRFTSTPQALPKYAVWIRFPRTLEGSLAAVRYP